MSYDRLPKGVAECVDAISALLKDKGVDNRDSAKALVETFFLTERHLSAVDMDALLADKGISLPLVVIEDSLEKLSDFGFAVRQKFEGEEGARYEHLHPHAHHDHFVCVTCKKIIEFKDDELEVLQDELMRKRGFKPLYHKLEVYGVCDACSQVTKKAIPLSFAKEETTVTLHKIESGWHFRKRLIELGFVDKERITIIKNSGFGPIVVEVKGARFAVGRGEANRILIYEQM